MGNFPVKVEVSKERTAVLVTSVHATASNDCDAKVQTNVGVKTD